MSSFILQLSIVLMVTCSNNLLVKYGGLSKYGADIPIAAMGIAMKVNQIVVNIVQGITTGAQPIIVFEFFPMTIVFLFPCVSVPVSPERFLCPLLFGIAVFAVSYAILAAFPSFLYRYLC